MHESRARTIALFCLLIVAGGFLYGSFSYVQMVREKNREAEAERVAAASNRVTLPTEVVADRYVEPAAITYPFF